MRDRDARPPHRRLSLAREITIVLTVKAVALYVIWLAFFSNPYAGHLDASGVARSLVDPAAQTIQSQEASRGTGPGSR